MEITFDTIRCLGEHGESRGPRLVVSCEDPGNVAFQVNTDEHPHGPFVVIDVCAMVSALTALTIQDAKTYAEFDRFHAYHDKTCKECKPA